MNSKQLTIDLIRHGEPVGGHRFRGKLDDPLTKKGFLQMQTSVESFSKMPWSKIYSSPLQRCLKFAKYLNQNYHIPLVIEPKIQEIDFGAWEGKTSEQIYQEDQVCLEQFWSDPMSFHPRDGEKLVDFKARIDHFLSTITTQHETGEILFITHSGVIKMILTYALGLPLNHLYRLKIDFGHMAQLQYFHDTNSFLLKAFNTKQFTHE